MIIIVFSIQLLQVHHLVFQNLFYLDNTESLGL